MVVTMIVISNLSASGSGGDEAISKSAKEREITRAPKNEPTTDFWLKRLATNPSTASVALAARNLLVVPTRQHACKQSAWPREIGTCQPMARANSSCTIQ